MAKKPSKKKKQDVDGVTGPARTYGSVARSLKDKSAFKQAVAFEQTEKELVNHLKKDSPKMAGMVKGAVRQTRKQQGSMVDDLSKALNKDFKTKKSKTKDGSDLITLTAAKAKRNNEQPRKGQKETKGRR